MRSIKQEKILKKKNKQLNSQEGKVTKARKSKKKDNISSFEESNPVCDVAEIEPEIAYGISTMGDDENSGVKRKAKKGLKSKKNKQNLSIEESDHVKNGEEIEPDGVKDDGSGRVKRKSKKARKSHKKDQVALNFEINSGLEGGVSEADQVFEISSGDEDCSRGMKKWLKEYHERSPGVKVLQERIDDFIASYEEEEEKARKEREEKAAEGGWTVVTHRKGGKKTTDPESGIAVGSVAAAAVIENMSKKKSKEVGLDFYRFQRREAQRSEIMKLQSKFEEDKKRIQQLRASRKFKPY